MGSVVSAFIHEYDDGWYAHLEGTSRLSLASMRSFTILAMFLSALVHNRWQGAMVST